MTADEITEALRAYVKMSEKEREELVFSYFKPEHWMQLPKAKAKAHLLLYAILLNPGLDPAGYAPYMYAALNPGKSFFDLRSGRPARGKEQVEKHLYRGDFIGYVSSKSNTLRTRTFPVAEKVDPTQMTNIRLRVIPALLAAGEEVVEEEADPTAPMSAQSETAEEESEADILDTYMNKLTEGVEDLTQPTLLGCQQKLEKLRKSLRLTEKKILPHQKKILPLLLEKRNCLRMIENVNNMVQGLKVMQTLGGNATEEDLLDFLEWRQARARDSIRVVEGPAENGG